MPMCRFVSDTDVDLIPLPIPMFSMPDVLQCAMLPMYLTNDEPLSVVQAYLALQPLGWRKGMKEF